MSTTFYNTLIISNVLMLLVWSPMLYQLLKWETKNLFRKKHLLVTWDRVDRFTFFLIVTAYIFFWFTFYFLIINY